MHLFRLLVSDPSKHHAIHLDSIRKNCDANPSTILKGFEGVNLSTVKVIKTVSVSRNAANQSDTVSRFDGIDDVEAKETLRENSDSSSSFSAFSLLGTKESKFKISR